MPGSHSGKIQIKTTPDLPYPGSFVLANAAYASLDKIFDSKKYIDNKAGQAINSQLDAHLPIRV